MESLKSSNTSAYNSRVAHFNSLVRAYNSGLAQLRLEIASYNQKVAERNAIALEEQQLVEALDTRLETQ